MITKLPGMKNDEQTIAFTRNEWKHFIEELQMRGADKIAQCVNNARYLDKMDRANEQLKNGQVIVKTWEELEAMAL